jgi:hypothetical protein
MPTFVGALRNGQALVAARLLVTAGRHAALVRAGQQPPAPYPVEGLVDTGADRSCIDPAARRALGLTPFRFGSAQPAGAASFAVRYFALALEIPFPGGNVFRLPTLTVVEMPLAVHGLGELLMGCDVLARCAFLYHGRAGKFRLRY